MDTERRELASIVAKRIKACSKRIRKIEMDLERLEGLAEFREMGELLKANLHLAKKGQSAVRVYDWAADAQRTIPVDPSLTPVENMEKMFKKAGKSKRGLTIARQRLSEAILEKDALEDLRYLVERAGDWESLNMLGEEIRPDQQAQGKGPQKETPKQPSREKPAGYDKFTAPVEGVVYVGKTAKGNDQILRTKAKKGDIWFHVKGAAGAHAVLVNQGQGPPDPKDIEFAARLALERSKVSSDSKHEVMMADVKDVKKLKGGPAGQVRVDKYSTIQVSPQ
jgi:predicted ribosome quality control (RQC) complex YloA/Tae2 family protein